MLEHAAPGAAEIVLEIFVESPDIVLQQVYYSWNAIDLDPDDNKFFDIAVAANVDYLVTNDRHFDKVKNLPFPKLNIIDADSFLTIINNLAQNKAKCGEG
jgi:predicted nucleic acid-binding protein